MPKTNLPSYCTASLKNPEAYGNLVEGKCKGLDQFLHTAASLGLVELEEHQYQFLPKLCEEHGFDAVRTENLVEVYANEVAPISCIQEIIKRAIAEAPSLDSKKLAELHFNDELVSFLWDKAYYAKPRFEEINSKETAVESGEPFLLDAGKTQKSWVLYWSMAFLHHQPRYWTSVNGWLH